MDIDEFLERELSEIGLSTDKIEKAGTSIEQSELKEYKPSDLYSLFENIKANIGKGNIDLAEQSYVQLWHILMQQKLKWSKELYDQLFALSRQFSSELNKVYGDVKRKAEQINELINRARASLKEGKKEMPFKLYSQIEEIYKSIPNVFFEEKRLIEGQVIDFYKELKNTTDNELVKRVSALIQEINQLINKMDALLRANDMPNAILNYKKCLELYNQIPEGFLRHKNSAGMRLLEIYKNLSIYSEISNLQHQLGWQLPPSPQPTNRQTAPTRAMLVMAKKNNAKKNIEKGLYKEASKDIQEVLQLEPNDAEAKAINAKIKTLQ